MTVAALLLLVLVSLAALTVAVLASDAGVQIDRGRRRVDDAGLRTPRLAMVSLMWRGHIAVAVAGPNEGSRVAGRRIAGQLAFVAVLGPLLLTVIV